MKRFRRFLRLRKQEDAVKIVFLFILLGIGLVINSLYNGVLLYRQMQSPAEYALVKDAADGGLKRELIEIEKWKNISTASLYQEMEITVKYKENKSSFSCIELSEAYLKAVYGISKPGATKTFYMNQKAFQQIENNADSEVPPSSGRSEKEDKKLLVTYEMLDKEGEEGHWKVGKAEIVLAEENVPKEEPFVFCKGETPSLEKNAAGIRVFAGRQDLDGSDVEKMQALGFTIENMSLHQETDYLLKIRGIRIRYNLLAGAICLFSAWTLWKLRKGER